MSVPLLDLRAQHATIREEVVASLMKVVDAQAFILGEPVVELENAVARLSHTAHAIGWDFLNTLDNAAIDINAPPPPSLDFNSWLKTGRAFDIAQAAEEFLIQQKISSITNSLNR